ncbi:hypothetical protein L0F63_006109 [Massospora cicadina]|nr:hypothetical protein L0F63_006109 [Massospora cicadina]
MGEKLHSQDGNNQDVVGEVPKSRPAHGRAGQEKIGSKINRTETDTGVRPKGRRENDGEGTRQRTTVTSGKGG